MASPDEVIEEFAKAISEFAAYDGPVDAFHLAKTMYARFEAAHTERELESMVVDPWWLDSLPEDFVFIGDPPLVPEYVASWYRGRRNES